MMSANVSDSRVLECACTVSPLIDVTDSCPLSLVYIRGKYHPCLRDSEYQGFAEASVPADVTPWSRPSHRHSTKTTLLLETML